MHRADALVELCRHIFTQGNAIRTDFAVIEVGKPEEGLENFVRISFNVDEKVVGHSNLAREALNALYEDWQID